MQSFMDTPEMFDAYYKDWELKEAAKTSVASPVSVMSPAASVEPSSPGLSDDMEMEEAPEIEEIFNDFPNASSSFYPNPILRRDVFFTTGENCCSQESFTTLANSQDLTNVCDPRLFEQQSQPLLNNFDYNNNSNNFNNIEEEEECINLDETILEIPSVKNKRNESGLRLDPVVIVDENNDKINTPDIMKIILSFDEVSEKIFKI